MGKTLQEMMRAVSTNKPGGIKVFEEQVLPVRKPYPESGEALPRHTASHRGRHVGRLFSRLIVCVFAICLSGMLLVSPAFAQEAEAPADTTQRESTGSFWWSSRLPEGHSPEGALWRAAVLPGWGQFYNRQYIKMPVVWAGIGGVAGLAYFNNQRYLTFRRAALYAQYIDAPPSERDPAFRESYQDEYERALRLRGYGTAPQDEGRRKQVASDFRAVRDVYRRNRDLSYFGIGIVYGLTILDAYVAAHLLDFDVGEDLTVSVYPMPHGVSAALRVGL